MSLQMAMGIAQGAMSIIGDMNRNAAIKKAATESYNANLAFIERDQSVLNEQLINAGNEVNNQAGMALSNLVYEALRAEGQAGAKRAETNIYGNTAARQMAVLAMKEEMSKDNIIQQAEAKLVDVSNKLRDVKYQTEAKHAQNAQSYNNAMSQQKSSFDMVAGAVGAGVSGYSQAMDFGMAQNSLAIQKQQAAGLGITLPFGG